MSFALLFSGQGTQHADMLSWLTDDPFMQAVNEELQVGDWRAALRQANWATNNANAQILLTGIGLAAWSQIAEFLPPPAAIAGYSVGELAAFSAAGVFDMPTALWLARARSHAMDRAAAMSPGGLLAVSGLPEGGLPALLSQSESYLAIRNSDEAVVVGGSPSALDIAQRLAVEAGAKCTRLQVEVASHTPLMQAATTEFAHALSACSMRAPRTYLFSNVLDRIAGSHDVPMALAAQVAQTVRWDCCMENVRERRVNCILEIGPGSALARMWTRRYPDIPARSADEFHSRKALLDWIGRHA